MTNLSPTLRRPGVIARHFTMAVALACGTALVGSLGFADVAQAQRKKEKKEEAKASYSKEFVAAYQPIEAALNAPGADAAALKPQVLALVPLAVSPDERQATGGLVYNTGLNSGDQVLQLQGIEMLLTSGKTLPDQLGRFNFTAYQLANSIKDYSKARQYLQAAIDNNFTTDRISSADLEITMAEIYFAEEQYSSGIDYLSKAIDARKVKGEVVDAAWYRRGITVAYSNEVVPQVYNLVVEWVNDYPSPENWRDAVNLTRNLNDFEASEALDLLRLARQVGTLKDKQDYIIYVEAADARRLPKEVKDVIEQGYSTGAVSRDDIYLAESLTTANGRIASDRADLPALEKDAIAPSAQLRTVTAAGSAFLSYGEYAKAANFFEKSLSMPGVDRNESLTRLGIAQVGMGDHAAALSTFEQVEGKRAPIAKLWAAYAAKQSAGGAVAGL